MSYYPLLKHAHIMLALISGLGFALRGFVQVVLDRPVSHPVIRVTPHIIDTLLLASGITLWLLVGWPFLSWLGVKITLIVVYIVLGMLAFRGGHTPRGILLYLLSLVVFVTIAVIAVHKPALY
ncbi:MAG: SirB2 family protein [Pseudomonadota bacterium]|nr:MAG: SirB2 family protein [Pseudomonadota bacterium]